MNTKDKTELIEYYLDQISFYTNRAKRAERGIKDSERIGLPVRELHLRVLADEKENIERYKIKLEKLQNE